MRILGHDGFDFLRGRDSERVQPLAVVAGLGGGLIGLVGDVVLGLFDGRSSVSAGHGCDVVVFCPLWISFERDE